MALNRGTWVRPVGAVGVSSADARRADGATYYNTTSGTVRTGLLWPNSSSFQLVTTTGTWNYSLAAVPGFIIGRAAGEGAYTMSSTGTTLVPTGVAPAAGLSRWDLIYIKQNDTEKGDANNDPVIGVTQGAAASSPTKPTASVPTGAVVIAEAQIFSGTTSTGSAANTLTQTWKYTALVGTPVPVRNQAERDELNAGARPSDQVRRLDSITYPIETWSGAAWTNIGRKYAEYTGPVVTSSAGAGVSFGQLTTDSTLNFNNSFSSARAGGNLNILEDGVYQLTSIALPSANPGNTHLWASIAGVAVISMNFSGYGATSPIGSATFFAKAGDIVAVGVTTANTVTTGSRVKLAKLMD